MKPTPKLFTDIAREHLNIPTLEPRNADSLDFHDVSVCGVKNALSHAYQAGVNASAENAHLIQKQLTSSGMFHTPGVFRALQNDFRISGKPRQHAIKTLSNGYGLLREEAVGLLSGAITSEIDDAAGTVTFTSRCGEAPASITAAEAACPPSAPSPSAPGCHPRFEIEHDPAENSDRVYVLVDGKFDVAIVRTDEGVVVDIYPMDEFETIATAYAFDSDVKEASSTN